MAGKAHTFRLLADEENQKPPGCSRTIDKMGSWSERKMAIHGLRPMIWSLPTVPSPSCMVPQTGGGGNAGSNFEQSLLLLLLQPALRSSKEIVATFGWLEDLPMLVNQPQLFSFFIFFLFFMSTLLFCWRSLPMLIDAGHNLFSWIEVSFEGFKWAPPLRTCQTEAD